MNTIQQASKISKSTINRQITPLAFSQMSECLRIPQCSQCNYDNESICDYCHGNHILNTAANTCECQQNPACADGEICVVETAKCVAHSTCLANPYCSSCSSIDPVRCFSCKPGFALDAEKVHCEKLECSEIEHCRSCAKDDPTRCESCFDDMTIADGGLSCECVIGSKKGCLSNEICSEQHNCVKKSACFSVEKCLKCDPWEPTRCEACENGHVPDRAGGECVISGCDDANCQSCPDKKKCQVCQPNLTLSRTNEKCECVPDSRIGCEDGYECSRDDRVCVLETNCLSAVQNCEYCYYHDTRLCDICDEGYLLSVDRKSCLSDKACFGIKGCSKCVASIPDLCDVCEGEKIGFGQSCQVENKLSVGAIVGIVIALVIVVIGVGVGVGFLIKKKNSNQIRDENMPQRQN